MSAERMRHLAVIPARGGSKRLPRKNVLDFFGKPIIAHTIGAALETKIFDRVLVSTEDDEIAEIAERYRADIDRRPDELATDAATINQVCLELIGRLERGGESYDVLTVLYATAPLRTAKDIVATVGLIAPGQCEFSMAVTEFAQPVHQALQFMPDGTVCPVFPDLVTRRADGVGRYVAGNGSTYCATVSAFRRERSFYGAPLKGHIMPRTRSVDIDTADDLALAAYYYRLVHPEN